jgi:hypothetical protein
VAEIENVAKGKRQVLQKLGKSTSATFQMTKQEYSEKPWAAVLCLNGTSILYKGETFWKMMSTPVGKEQSQLNSRSKK